MRMVHGGTDDGDSTAAVPASLVSATPEGSVEEERVKRVRLELDVEELRRRNAMLEEELRLLRGRYDERGDLLQKLFKSGE